MNTGEQTQPLVEGGISEQEDTTLHLGLIRISMPLIYKILGLPEDYQYSGIYPLANRNELHVIAEHPSLPVYVEGQRLPEVAPIYTRKSYSQPPDVELVEIQVHEHARNA